jgi:hypothetical protein
VQNVFKSQQTCDIGLFKYDEENPYSQLLANNPTQTIYEGGFRYLPILHNLGTSTSITQSFTLNNPIEITVQGSTSTPGTGESNPANYVLGYHSCETDFGSGYSEYRIYISASYIGGGAVSNNISLQVSTAFTVNGTCGTTRNFNIEIPVSGYSALSNDYIAIFPPSVTPNGTGNSNGCSGPFASPVDTHWPPFSVYPSISRTCALSVVSLTGGGGGGGETTFESTFLISEATGSPCIYYLSESKQLAFTNLGLGYYYYNPLTFDSTSDSSWSTSELERVVVPFSLTTGDKLSVYNGSSTPEWDEKWEYTVVSSYVSGSGETGSILFAQLDSSINAALLSSGSGTPIDPFTGSPYRLCRYVIWKHVPDETNVMLRYNPKDPRIIEEGLLFPQYISKEVKLNAGNTIKALRGQNLLPPQP